MSEIVDLLRVFVAASIVLALSVVGAVMGSALMQALADRDLVFAALVGWGLAFVVAVVAIVVLG